MPMPYQVSETLGKQMSKKLATKRMLVFHSAYTYQQIVNTGMEIFVQARDAGNYFDHILTVSPLASLQYEADHKGFFGKPTFHKLDEKNTILEGRVGRFRLLQNFPRINFLLAQFSLTKTIFIKGNLHNVKLVRAEDPRVNGIYGYFFSSLLRIPLIVGVWGNPGRLRDMNGRPNMPRLFSTMKSEERLEKFVLKRARVVLSQNAENMSYVLDSGVPTERTMFTELGVGIDKSHFLPKSERENVIEDFEAWDCTGKFLIICISRLEKSKMVDHAIKAVSTLKSAGVDFKLILVGDGRELMSLKLLAKDEGLMDNVIFTGNRSQSWIAGALTHININLAPLCGRALLEASLAGCAAVAYDIDWHSEIVISGATGYLVPVLNFRMMGQKTLDLYRNPVLCNTLGANMYEAAKRFARPDSIAQKQLQLYKSLVG
jgi:glycosyltransferase involved in cell wall biosynthesis